MYMHTLSLLHHSVHTPLHRQRACPYPVPTGRATRSRILSAHLLSIFHKINSLRQLLAEQHQAVAHLSPPPLLKSLVQKISEFAHPTTGAHGPHLVVSIATYTRHIN